MRRARAGAAPAPLHVERKVGAVSGASWSAGALAMTVITTLVGCGVETSSSRAEWIRNASDSREARQERSTPETSERPPTGFRAFDGRGAPIEDGDWPVYGRDAGGSRYSPLSEIRRENVAELEVAWTYRTGDVARYETARGETAFEATPLVVDGTLYFSTPFGRVIALDAVRGTERWTFDPEIDVDAGYGDFTSRGVSLWVDDSPDPGTACRSRIYVATIDARLIALDASRGTVCPDFGVAGTVDLRVGIRNGIEYHAEYEETSPPAVVRDLVVVGSAIADNNRADAPSGVVRAFDARTGALRWAWDPVPQDSTDAAWSSWRGPVAHRSGAANAWSVITVDAARDLVFVPTGSPSPDYYGGTRHGDNRYANSLVALRASTGEVVWSFQVVHHDLWDYDVPAPPALVTVLRDGRDVPAVVQATKVGHLFVLHRDTGEPLFPVEERPVPASDVPGEEAAPTQPFPLRPASLSPQSLTPDQAWGLTAKERAWCRERIRSLHWRGMFTPPATRETLVVPGNVGGAHWGGVALDPSRGLAIVPTNHLPAVVRLIPRADYEAEEDADTPGQVTAQRGAAYGIWRHWLFAPSGALCVAPPWGSLTAVDLNTGAFRWRVPLGGAGSPNLGGGIVTAGGLVFIGAAFDSGFRAYDVETGRELWAHDLPVSAKATPMTYRGRDGRQYVVVAAGGQPWTGMPLGDYLIAFRLPAAPQEPASSSR